MSLKCDSRAVFNNSNVLNYYCNLFSTLTKSSVNSSFKIIIFPSLQIFFCIKNRALNIHRALRILLRTLTNVMDVFLSVKKFLREWGEGAKKSRISHRKAIHWEFLFFHLLPLILDKILKVVNNKCWKMGKKRKVGEIYKMFPSDKKVFPVSCYYHFVERKSRYLNCCKLFCSENNS